MSLWDKVVRVTAGISTGGLSELAYNSDTIAKGAKSVLGAVTGQTAIEEAAKAQRKAYEEQLSSQERMSQWGYGYPQWMLDKFEEIAKEGGTTAEEVEAAYRKLGGTYGKYTEALSEGGTAESYKQLAKDAWNQSFTALSEVPGMTSGQRLAAMSTITSKYGTALTEAGIYGERERINRATAIFNANKEYGKLGMDLPSYLQEVEMSPLKTAASLSSRYNGTPTVPLEAPSFGTTLGTQLSQLALQGAGYALGGPIGGVLSSGVTNLFKGSTSSAGVGQDITKIGYNPYTVGS